MTDLIGRTLGTYKIIDEIGHGGMANVYRATQPSIGREVAIKVLPPHFLQDRTFVRRFTREVQVIASLQHPHILPVYDFGEQDGLPYIVMAYMPGGTLADRMRKVGALPLPEVTRLVEQIADGLDHAHQKGIVHRDFKPSNVLLDEHGNVYLADFGIAKVAESTTQLTGSGIVGTPAYMAPEVTRTDKVTRLIDVYALGVSVFEMLAGQHPYPSDTPVGVLLAHAAEPIPSICDSRPDLPEGLQHVIDRAMAKEPSDRYQSAGALAGDLQVVLAGQTPLTEPVARPAGSGHVKTIRMAPTSPVPGGLPRRNMAMIIGAVATVAILGGAAALGGFSTMARSMIAQVFSGPPATATLASQTLPTAEASPTLHVAPTLEPSPVPLSDRILAGHSDAVSSIALSPDGKLLASGSLDKRVILWDLQTDQPVRTIETPDEVYSMVFSPDGERLLVGGQNGTLSAWFTDTGEPAFEARIFLPSWQIDVDFAPSQAVYAVASRDKNVALYDAAKDEWLRVAEHASPIWTVAYSPDSSTLAAGGEDGSITLRAVQTDEVLHTLQGHSDGVTFLAFSPDGETLASASHDMTVILWSTATGEKLLTLSQHTGPVNGLAWSPDGKTLASASDDGALIVWSTTTGGILETFEGGGKAIGSAIFSLDGALLASGMQDGTVVLWKVE
jgi:serine/threonine protein kinase